jgi:ribose-phosphate pyrophosphokinase
VTTSIYSTQSYSYLADELCRVADTAEVRRGLVETRLFPDGERYLRLVETRSPATVLIGGTICDNDTLEFFDLACELANSSQTLTMIVPYFGYSTMERSVHAGEVVTAKNRARLLSAIPQSRGGNRIIFVDLHSAGIPHYLESGLGHHHLYAKKLIDKLCREMVDGPFVLGSADSGRAQWVESLAKDMQVAASFVFKQRLDGVQTRVLAVQALVAGQRVIIYDDMIRTGGSLLKAATAYLEAGASEVYAVATHGVFPDGAMERIQKSGLIRAVGTTDSHPRARKHRSDFLRVTSLAPLLLEHLQG